MFNDPKNNSKLKNILTKIEEDNNFEKKDS